MKINLKTTSLAVCVLASLMAAPSARAQFTYSITKGAITITGYTGSGGAVDIPATLSGSPVTAIGDNAFYNKPSITSVTMPNSVTSFGGYAFAGCSGLTSVKIPNGVTSIGGGAFYGCSGLTSVKIPDSVTSLGPSVFAFCSGLTSVTISTGVTSLGTNAFYYCSGLTSVMIPDSITSISNRAFAGCSGLTSVTIPNSVTNIGTYTFAYCSRLTNATFYGNAPTVNGGSGSLNNTVFAGATGTAYHLGQAMGWGSTFGGWPTAPLAPPAMGITTYSNQPLVFFSTAASTNFVLQMTTNQASGNWVTITNGMPINAFVITNPPGNAFFRLY